MRSDRRGSEPSPDRVGPHLSEAVDLDQGIDLVVYGEFEDEQALAAYKAHPLYEESIRRVKPLRGDRFAEDYRAGDAVMTRI